MVCLEKLDRSDFEEVYRIMEQSFPADERRKKEGQQKLLDEEKYELLGVRNEGGLLAFLAVWEFAEFVFIEHFAVSEKAPPRVTLADYRALERKVEMMMRLLGINYNNN